MKKINLLLVLCFLSAFSFPQSIDWQQVFHDGSGRPLFTGGESYSNPSFADIDNDGDLDCFMGGDKGAIVHYENIGTADSAIWHFVTNMYNNINIPQISKSNVTFVDIDADGDLDMFFGGARSTDVTGIFFYRNDGNANAPDWVFVTDKYMDIETGTAYLTNYCKTTFADMDNDGDMDLLFGNYRKDVYYENVGDAENADFILGNPDYFNFGSGYYNYHNPTFVDIDGDGDFDCFLGITNSHFLFYENIGTLGTANWELVTEEYIDIACCENIAPAFCDIDGDQDYDMFVGLSSGKVLSYENQSLTNVPEWLFLNDNPITIDIGYNSNITIADIYGNNKPSLFMVEGFMGSMDNSIIEHVNAGTAQEPMWQPGTTMFFNIHYPDDWINSLYFADIDNDMDLDMFIGPGFGNKIMLHENTGDPFNPQFDSIGVVALAFDPASNVMFNPVLVDIDNDNDLDMYISAQETVMGYDAMIWHYRNDGTSELANWQLEYVQPAQWGKIAFMDEDGDGDLDAFYSGFLNLFQMDDSLYLYENTGDVHNPEFNLTNTDYLPIEIEMFSAITFYDADSDNDIDIYLGGMNGGIFHYENKGLIQQIENNFASSGNTNLLNCYPVPSTLFSGITIDYSVPETSNVDISIINPKGQIIGILNERNMPSGNYSVKWRGVDVQGFNVPGIYFCRLIIGKKTTLKKFVRL